ncbi:MAG: IPT/TIG domain-containing protein [Bryobacteraceae bacterium]
MVALVATGSNSGNAQVLQSGVWSDAVPFSVNTLHVASVDPASGAAGTSVTFTGTGFGSSQGNGTVVLGSTAGVVVSWSDTQIVATVASASVTGVARVQQNGAWSNALAFTVTVEGVPAQTLVPSALTMMAGDTRAIQALDASGQPVTGLTWSSSDTTVVSLSTDDPPLLAAVAAGHVTITAGNASADVTVSADPLPLGTILWSNPGNASGVYQIVPAVPSPTGAADVFAFQGDGTVQAITSDGTTAWTADVSQASNVLPDFLGGLVTLGWGSGGGSIARLDGTTGEAIWTYTAPSTSHLEWSLALHTDGTVFAVQEDWSENPGPPQVIGLDGTTGGLKFAIPLPSMSSDDDEGATTRGPIIAGDGNAYVSYGFRDWIGGELAINHVRVLQIGSGGSYADIPVYDWASPLYDLVPIFWGATIANNDTGVVLTWDDTYGDGNGDDVEEYKMAIIAGGSATVFNAPFMPGQYGSVEPVLQAQDGSFVGTAWNGDTWTPYMISFDASGNVRWSVSNDQPQIATADGGTIGQSGIAYDQNGNATGQVGAASSSSWIGQAYSSAAGDVSAIVQSPTQWASTFETVAGGNPSANLTSVAFLTWMEGSALWGSGRGPQCQLGGNKVPLGGDALQSYSSLRQSLLAGNYLNSQTCSLLFAPLQNGPAYFSQLATAVTDQAPYDGNQTTISMYDAGLWAAADVGKPTFPVQWRKTPVCSNMNSDKIVAEAQIQSPATDVYINTRRNVLRKYLSQSTILHEALHNLTSLDDDGLEEYLCLAPTASQGYPTDVINKVLIQNGCAPND